MGWIELSVNVFKLTDAVCIKLPVSPEPTLLILVAKEAEVISNAPDISDFNAAVELAAKEPVTAVNVSSFAALTIGLFGKSAVQRNTQESS